MAVEVPEAVVKEEAELEAGERVAGAAMEVEPEEGIRNQWEVRCRSWDPMCRLGTCKCAISCSRS